MKKIILFIIVIALLSSCAITNKGEMRQNIVSKSEIELMSYFREGMYHFKNNRYLDATQAFERALFLNNNPKIRYNLALALERLGDTDKALAIMTELYYNYPEEINYKMGQARMLDLVGKKDEAVVIYNEVLEILEKKNDVKDYRYKVYRRLSDLYYKIGDIDEATCYSQMAFNEKLSKDDLLRHVRLLLSVDVPIRDIYSLSKVESKRVQNEILRKKNELEQNGTSFADSFESQDSQDIHNNDVLINGSKNDCRLESVFAFAFLDDFKQNKEVLSEIIARSKECLNNKDSYYPVLTVLEKISSKYSDNLSGNTLNLDEEEDNFNVSDTTILNLPGSSYKYIEKFLPTFNIAKN